MKFYTGPCLLKNFNIDIFCILDQLRNQQQNQYQDERPKVSSSISIDYDLDSFKPSVPLKSQNTDTSTEDDRNEYNNEHAENSTPPRRKFQFDMGRFTGTSSIKSDEYI